MRCPGSIEAEAGLPDESSEAAREGTLAHYVLFELALPQGLEPDYFVGLKRKIDGHVHEFTQEHADALLDVYDLILGLPGKHFYENRVSLEPWLPGQGGTADVGIYTKSFVMIRDLKFGAGIPVSPEENEQLLCYMLGLLVMLKKRGHPLGDRKLILAIDQPRCPGGGGEWEITRDDLLDFAEKLKIAGQKALKPGAPRIPGPKQCQWCKAKNQCKELAEFNLALAQQEFDDLDYDELSLPNPAKLSVDQRAKILKHESLFKDWLKALHFAVLKDAVAGRPTGGFKAVHGRAPHRKWGDEKKALADMTKFGLDPWSEPKLISPAEAEKRVKSQFKGRAKVVLDAKHKALKSVLAESVDGTPKAILVPDDDPRPAILGVDMDFEDLGDED